MPPSGDLGVAPGPESDRRSATGDEGAQVVLSDELGVFLDGQPDTARDAGQQLGNDEGPGVKEMPQYRCCCRVRLTVVSTPAPRVPVLPDHCSGRPSFAATWPCWSVS